MFVGRELELLALDSSYQKMVAGSGSVLFLTGEAGLGKTTLVHEWWASVASRTRPVGTNSPDSVFLESACSVPIGGADVGRLEALQPWADVIALLERVPAPEPPVGESGNARRKLDMKRLIHDAAPAWAWALPLVGDFAHAALETSRLIRQQRNEGQPDLPAARAEYNPNAQNQQQVFQQYVNLVTTLAQQSPLAIFLDDLHWADVSSCNLLFYLSRQISEHRILVIATYRQDDAMAAQGGKGHPVITVKNEILRYGTGTEIALNYLGRNAIRSFLNDTFPGYVVDDRFERWLEKSSDGNALFMTQFVKTLHDDGHLNDLGAFVGDYATITIPASALAVVEERIRRLDPSLQELLTCATVEGEEFTTYVLAQLSDRKPRELFRELHSAIQQGLIMERGSVHVFATKTALYSFSHALFHRALYERMLGDEQRFLHRQCLDLLRGEWERTDGAHDRSPTLAAKVLTHAEKCEEWTIVADVSLAAAHEFWATYAEDEALEMTRRTLIASDHAGTNLHAQRAEAIFLRGRIAELRGAFADAEADYRTAEQAFRQLQKLERSVDAANGLGIALYRVGAYERALQESLRALAEAETRGYALGEASAHRAAGNALAARGSYAEALEHLEKSRSLCVKIGDVRGEANAIASMGVVEYSRGALVIAMDLYAKSLALYRTIGDRRGEAIALMNTGGVLLSRGAHEDAQVPFEESMAICRSIGDRPGEAIALSNIGSVFMARGAHAEALARFSQSHELCESIGDRQGEALARINIASVLTARCAYSDAAAHFNAGIMLCRELGDRWGESSALTGLGDVFAAQGEFADSVVSYRQGLSICEDIGNRMGAATALAGIGGVLCTCGNWDEAMEVLLRSRDIRRETGDVRAEANTLILIGFVHYLRGEHDKALDLYAISKQQSAALGNRQSEASAMTNIAHVHAAKGEMESAIGLYDRCLEMFRNLGDHLNSVEVRVGRGCALRSMARYAEARRDLTLALETATSIGARAKEASARGELGTLLLLERSDTAAAKVRNCHDAIHMFRRAAELCRESGMVRDAVRWEAELALLNT
jgi:tetratricopeptide (TPR) repeat protein